MEILVSGEAGITAVLTANVQIRYVDGRSVSTRGRTAPLGILRGVGDVRRATVSNVAEADSLLRVSWSVDRFWRLLSVLTEDNRAQFSRPEFWNLAAGLLQDRAVKAVIENRIYAAPLPPEALGALSEEEVPAVIKSIFQPVISLRKHISEIHARYFSLPDTVFETPACRPKFWAILVDAGSVREWADALSRSDDLQFLYLQLSGRHRQHEGLGQVLREALAISKALAPAAGRTLLSDGTDWEDDIEMEPGESRAAYENALAQQRAIRERLVARDLETARRYAEELISQQLSSSGSERVGKSLSSIAQAAKTLGLPKLQLEWAHRAVEVSPADPKTWGHYADALIGEWRFIEADEALQRVEQQGGQFFALTQRARMLRLQGRPDEARTAFLEAAKQFDSSPDVHHALSGAAEALRDLNRPEEALKEYDDLLLRWPNEPGLRSGYASALLDLGRYQEALTAFGKAASLDGSPVPMNGQASALKMSGRLREAAARYEELLGLFPEDAPIKCGAADVFRLLGQLDRSEELYRDAQRLLPASHIPVLGIADVLRDRGDHQAALAFLETQPVPVAEARSIKLAIALSYQNMGSLTEAAKRLDAMLFDYPHYPQVRLAKADFMRRIGHFQDAMSAYDNVIRMGAFVHQSKASKAACLIALQRFDEAEALLPNARPHTSSDWHRYLVRGALLHARGQTQSAIRHIKAGIADCPFIKSRKLLSNLLSSILLSRREFKPALQAAEPMPGHPYNVVYIHALLANHRSGAARLALEQAELPADTENVYEKIVAFHETNAVGRPSRSEVSRLEQHIFLMAA